MAPQIRRFLNARISMITSKIKLHDPTVAPAEIPITSPSDKNLRGVDGVSISRDVNETFTTCKDRATGNGRDKGI